MIYTFGNSHAHLFTRTNYGIQGWGQKTNEFLSFSKRPMAAKEFYDTHVPILGRIIPRKYKTGDFLLISVGERDCTQHIPEEAFKKGRPPEELVKEHVDAFFVAVDLIQSKGCKLIGWGGHPSNSKEFVKATPYENDPRFLANITRTWDKYIGESYKSRGIPYVSVIEDLLREDGTVDPIYFPEGDDIHLHHITMIPILQRRFAEQGFNLLFT